MKSATFIFYDSLNDFLAPPQRGFPVVLNFQGAQSTKHLVESLHIPHPEIRSVHANGVAVGFSFQPQDRDQMEIFPFRPQDFTSVDPPRFLLDNHLGKLATFLRILGFDSAYCYDTQDAELALISSREERVLLTRDRGLLMRSLVTQGYCLRSLDPHHQLGEILERFDLAWRIQPFRRCLRCNAILEQVQKDAILSRLEPLTRKYFDEFRRCPACDQIFWKGSHYEHMQEFLESLPGVKII